jgi:hypothetical protein
MNPMKLTGTGRLAAILLFLLACLAGGPAEARDVYKAFLDPGIPRHRAVLDTLQRLEANPLDAGLKNDLGCLIAQEGFWRDAIREFEEAGKLDKKASRPYFNAGLVRAMRSEWRDARGAFQKAADRDPGNWPAWWMLGYAEEQLGNTDAAVDAYKRSLRVDNSLFDVTVNPYAAQTKLRLRVFLETYDNRRVRVMLPSSEQLSDPERVASFFQKEQKGDSRSAAVPVVEPKSGPVISSVPAASTMAPPPARTRPTGWNPQASSLRRRDESRQPPDMQQPPPPPVPTLAPSATVAAPAGEAAGQSVSGTAGPGVGGPGMGGPGIGGAPPPAPTPAPN